MLWLLNPALVQPKRDNLAGKLYYLLIDTGGKLLPENMIHVAGLGFDGLVGFSAIHQCRQVGRSGHRDRGIRGQLLRQWGHPRGVFKIPRKLSSTARQNLRESYYASTKRPKMLTT